jgi:hypothetical protein
MTDPNIKTQWSVYGQHAPVVSAYCPRCHLKTEFYGKLALAPQFRHCASVELMPSEVEALVAAYKRR